MIYYTHNKEVVKRQKRLDERFFMGIFTDMSERGRPPKPADELKTASMKIPLTEREKEAIEQAAKARDAKPVTWARDVLMRAAKRT